MSAGNFQKLRQIVLQDVDLQEKLQAFEDRDEFIKMLIELGRDHDLKIEIDDILSVMQENRRVWIERWI